VGDVRGSGDAIGDVTGGCMTALDEVVAALDPESTSDGDHVAAPESGAEQGKPPQGLVRDLVELAKPGITFMCLLMTAGAMAYAWALGTVTPDFSLSIAVWALVGTTLSVVAANTMNMVIEREGDKRMVRTRNRPLASGRMSVWAALLFGVVGIVAATWILWTRVNPLTCGLSLFAFGSYVLIYTPLKRVTPQALVIGAVPGALPPLIGWTAATNRIDAIGLVLFGVLLIWQLPHFIAIAIYRFRDYASAGIKTVPVVRGEEVAKVQSVVYTIFLFPMSLLLVPLNGAGSIYFIVASVLGAWFFVLGVRGFEPGSNAVWARQFFLASLVYLPVWVLGLVVDVLVERWWLA
jgi:protoheme IX farnesyltransferase